MNVICTQENLRAGLNTASRIISSSNTLPVLNNVLLKTENGVLHVSATNLEISIRTYIRCKIETEGSVCVPAKTLSELVGTLPNKNITLSQIEAELMLETDAYKAKVKTLPSEEFPVIPQIEKGMDFTVAADTLKAALEQVLFAASLSETQPEISGVLFRTREKSLKLVATDRYRLAEKEVVVPGLSGEKDVIVPHRTCVEIIRILGQYDGEVGVSIGDNQISLTAAETMIMSRLIDGQYPEYEQIVPDQFITTINTERQELLAALKTSGIFSYGTNSIKLEYGKDPDYVIVSSGSQDLGESTVRVPAVTKGGEGTLLFNFRYLSEALGVMSGNGISLFVNEDTTPVIVREQDKKDYFYLVMPIKS